MKGLVVHAILASIGLITAYTVWAGNDVEKDVGDVTILECSKDSLQEVLYENPTKRVSLKFNSKDGKRSAWVSESNTPKKGKKTSTTFVGGSAVDDYVAKVSPLRALRRLGSVDKETLKEIKLDKPDTFITFKCGSRKQKFSVGAAAFGSGNRYLRAGNKGDAYLVHADLVRDLQSAEFRLMQRELYRFSGKDIHTLAVKGMNRSKELLHRNRLDPAKAEWVDKAAPDRRNELYGNWLDRVERLRAQKYLGKGKAPGSDLEMNSSAAANQVLELEYRAENGDVLGTTTLTRVDTDKEPEYYAKSNATQVWVKVPASLARQIEEDVPVVLGLQAPKKENPADNGAAPAAPGAVTGGNGAAAPAPPVTKVPAAKSNTPPGAAAPAAQ